MESKGVKKRRKFNGKNLKNENYDSSQEEHQFSIINILNSQTFYENRLELYWNFYGFRKHGFIRVTVHRFKL